MLLTNMMLAFAMLISLFGLPVSATTADGIFSAEIDSSHSSHDIIDYTQFIGSDSGVPDYLKNAIMIAENPGVLPTCSSMAFVSMMHACATLPSDPPTGDIDQERVDAIDEALRDQKTLCAVRLAICELEESQAPIPPACASFVPTRENTKKTGTLGYFWPGQTKPKVIVNYPEYEAATKRDLPVCLFAIRNTDQAWTSYSNSRQNVVAMCHAARARNEKEQITHLHKILAENTASVAENMRHVHKDQERIHEAFEYLVSRASQYVTDLDTTHDHGRASAFQTVNEFENKLRAKMEGIYGELESINNQIRNSASQVHDAHSEFSGAIQRHGSDLAAISQDAQRARELEQIARAEMHDGLVQDLDKTSNAVALVGNVAGTAVETVHLVTNQSEFALEMLRLIGGDVALLANNTEKAIANQEKLESSLNRTQDTVEKLDAKIQSTWKALNDFFGSIGSIIGFLGFAMRSLYKGEGMVFIVILACVACLLPGPRSVALLLCFAIITAIAVYCGAIDSLSAMAEGYVRVTSPTYRPAPPGFAV